MDPIDYQAVHTEYQRTEPRIRALVNLIGAGGFTQEEVQPMAELVAADLEALAATVRGK